MICNLCGEKIISGEKYIENSIGKQMHYDCQFDLWRCELLKWAGIDIKIKEDEIIDSENSKDA